MTAWNAGRRERQGRASSWEKLAYLSHLGLCQEINHLETFPAYRKSIDQAWESTLVNLAPERRRQDDGEFEASLAYIQ